MGRPIISAFADEYDASPIVHAEYLASVGVGYIEPRFVNERNVADLAENEVKEYKKILDANGIAAYSVGSPIGKINLADDFAAHLDRAKRCFENAVILGAKRIRAFSFYLRDGQSRAEARSEVVEKLSHLLELADEYSLTLCHENEAKIYGENAESCLDLFRAFDGRLRCVFDMGNFVLDGVEPYPHAYNLLKDYIEYFHIKDSLSVGAIVPPGKGEARIAEILAEHSRTRAGDFFVTLEPHLETFSGLNKLVGKQFENPYKFDTPKIAFDTAMAELKKITEKLG